MKRFYILFIMFVYASVIHAQIKNNREEYYPMTGTEKPGWIEDYIEYGGPYGGASRFTEDGIVLTNTKYSLTGFIIKDLEVDLVEGAVFEFEYTLSEMNDVSPLSGGLTFFLVDSKANVKKMGYGGSGLGYVYNISSSTETKPGINGAYLGIGFDVNGYSKSEYASKAYQLREGISRQRYLDQGTTSSEVWNQLYDKHITLRGGFMNDYRGFPVLYTHYYGNRTDKSASNYAQLDYKTGQYIFGKNEDAPKFDITNGGADPNPNFQTIIVEIKASEDKKSTFVSVKSRINGQEVILIDNFKYDTAFKTFRQLGINTPDEELYQYNVPIPDKVKIGFVGATEKNRENRTIIRNLRVTPIQKNFVLSPMEEEICVSNERDNKGVFAKMAIVEPEEVTLDYTTFHFTDQEGNIIGDFSYEQASIGRWEYNATKNELMFYLDNQDFKNGDKAQVYYTIEGMSKEGKTVVKSEPALVEINGISCGAIMNKHIQGKATILSI
jgi:hypothetical protein